MEPWIIVVVAKKDRKIRLYWDGDYWKQSPMWAETYPADEAIALAWRLRTRFPDLADEIEVTTPPQKQDWSPRRPEMGAARRKKEEPKPYQFEELSKEAKERAIENYRRENRERLFDQDDAEHLTEIFENDLRDHYGLGDMEANWSLGYCQGDGVCFHGHVNLETFLKVERKKKRFGHLIGRASAKISQEDRYCHWNSMTVHVESDVDADSFLPERLRNRFTDWQYESRHRWEVRARISYDRAAPLRAWQHEVDHWRHEMQQKYYRKQDWTPRVHEPPPKPQELDLEMPPPLEMPADLKASFADAEKDYAEFVKDLDVFDEYLTGRVKEISKELEKMGYDEIEYHSSDEYLSERLADDETLYTKDGDLFEE